MFKVGDRVQRINGRPSVETVTDIGAYGMIATDGGRMYINSESYKLVEDDMKIKISSWEELDGKENTEYRINVFRKEYTMCLYTVNAVYMGEIDYLYTPKELILSQLKLFGFSVEFAEPIKLTKEEWHFVRSVSGGWVATDHSGESYYYPEKPVKSGNGWYSRCKSVYLSTMNIDFPHIKWTDTEPWSIESLRELECNEEII